MANPDAPQYLLRSGTERLTPIPDALLRFPDASPREQMRRALVVLTGVRRLYRKRFATAAGCFSFLGRVPNISREPVEAARRVFCAVTGAADLIAWERAQSRAAVERALASAMSHCAPAKKDWLQFAAEASR